MISIIILTKNEEKNIVDCLESASWADEVILVDDFSEDRTIEIIKTLNFSKKIKIFKRKLESNFSDQRNYALTKAKGDWVLFLDADERITKDLREEINSMLIDDKSNKKFDGYFIKRFDVIWGKMLKHGETGDTKLLRLGRRSYGSWIGDVHEEWMIDGRVSQLENHLIHYPHQTISEFLGEINFYTTIRARELHRKGVKSSGVDIILYPKAKFISNYFLKLGFLDGIEGFLSAILMSFHSFLVRSKLWIYSRK